MENFELDRIQGVSVHWLNYKGKNSKGETLIVELTKCENPGGKTSLPYLWKKHGFTDKIMETWWGVSTYVTDEKGNCWGKYNPRQKPYTRYHKGKLVECRPVINFDWLLEATEENAKKLLAEIERRFLEGNDE